MRSLADVGCIVIDVKIRQIIYVDSEVLQSNGLICALVFAKQKKQIYQEMKPFIINRVNAKLALYWLEEGD